jgi:hypothetical protein
MLMIIIIFNSIKVFIINELAQSQKANYRDSTIYFPRKSKWKQKCKQINYMYYSKTELITCIRVKLNLSGESIKQLQIIHRDGISVEYIYISISLPMAFAAQRV